MTSQVTFSRFRSSFLSGLYWSHSAVTLVANINWLQHNKSFSDGAVVSAWGHGSGGQWFESRTGKVFAPIKKN